METESAEEKDGLWYWDNTWEATVNGAIDMGEWKDDDDSDSSSISMTPLGGLTVDFGTSKSAPMSDQEIEDLGKILPSGSAPSSPLELNFNTSLGSFTKTPPEDLRTDEAQNTDADTFE